MPSPVRLQRSALAAEGVATVDHALPAALPFEGGSFDVVYARLALHYFGEAALASQILPEVRRVLRRGGALVVAVKTSAGDDGHFSRACGDAKVLMRPKKWEALVGGADLAVRASEAAMRNGTDDEAAAWKAAGERWVVEASAV